MFHKITDIKTLPGFNLWAEFSDGRQVCYDASALFDQIPEFADLKNIAGLFERVKIDAGGHGVAWSDRLDLDGEEIYNCGIVLKDRLELHSGAPCPECGQMIRRKSEAQRRASIANLAKRSSHGGRPVDPNSKRQKAIRAKNQKI